MKKTYIKPAITAMPLIASQTLLSTSPMDIVKEEGSQDDFGTKERTLSDGLW